MNITLISVVMPVYNGERYIDQAIESVLSQTYPYWELLIIDDGSKDKSLEKIRHWASSDSRIRVFYHPKNSNKGVSATRNLGLLHAKGDYIALLDCDDIWLPDKLNIQIQILEADPDLTIVYSKAIVVDDSGTPLSESKKKIKFPHSAGNGKPGKSSVFWELISDTIWMPCPTVVFSRKIIDKIGGFEESLKYQCEDHIFFILLSHFGSAYFCNNYLAKYRIHGSSYTTNNPWKISIFETYVVILKHFPQYHSEIKNLFELKLIEFFFIYFFDSSRKEFVSTKAMFFFQCIDYKIIFLKALLRKIFFGAIQLLKLLLNLITKKQ